MAPLRGGGSSDSKDATGPRRCSAYLLLSCPTGGREGDEGYICVLASGIPLQPDLDSLRDRLPEGWEVKEKFPDLAGLTAWAVQARYPGEEIEASRQDAEDAVEQAGNVYETILNELKRRGYRPEDPD